MRTCTWDRFPSLAVDMMEGANMQKKTKTKKEKNDAENKKDGNGNNT